MRLSPFAALLLAPSVIAAGALGGLSVAARAEVVLLEKIPDYVSWPTRVGNRPFILAVMGRPACRSELAQHFENRTLLGRPVRICWYRRLQDVGDCDLLFIAASEKVHLPYLLARLRGRPILTMGDTPGFATAGVMVNLVQIQDRMGFEVNLRAARDAGIRLAPGLVRMGRKPEE